MSATPILPYCHFVSHVLLRKPSESWTGATAWLVIDVAPNYCFLCPTKDALVAAWVLI